MITMALYEMPLAYAGVFLATVAVLWLSYGWRRERRRRKAYRELCQCRLCAEWLRHPGKAVLFRCPACGALNEHNFVNDI